MLQFTVQLFSSSLFSAVLLRSALTWASDRESGASLAQFPLGGKGGSLAFPYPMDICITISSALLGQFSLHHVLSSFQQVEITCLLFSVLLFCILGFIITITLVEPAKRDEVNFCRHSTMFK